MTTKYNVAIVGASGAVGREILKTLDQRQFPIAQIKAFSSPRSAGQPFSYGQLNGKFEALTDQTSFSGLDLIFFSAGGKVSEQWVGPAVQSGAVVIDNSSFFRMNPEVPLVVPEINSSDLVFKKGKGRLVANPNCTTAQLVMALKPLDDAFGLQSVFVSSYQAVSGRGQEGIARFWNEVEHLKAGTAPDAQSCFPRPIAFNCVPQIDKMYEDGFTGEEHKVMAETRKILGRPDLAVMATCVRVPVVNGHSVSAFVETDKPMTLEAVRGVLSSMPGLIVEKDAVDFPVATEVSGQDEVRVGRLRVADDNPHRLALWIVGDNLRKGAALNAVQIAEQFVTGR